MAVESEELYCISFAFPFPNSGSATECPSQASTRSKFPEYVKGFLCVILSLSCEDYTCHLIKVGDMTCGGHKVHQLVTFRKFLKEALLPN